MLPFFNDINRLFIYLFIYLFILYDTKQYLFFLYCYVKISELSSASVTFKDRDGTVKGGLTSSGSFSWTDDAPYRGHGYVPLRFWEGGCRKENGNTTTTNQCHFVS